MKSLSLTIRAVIAAAFGLLAERSHHQPVNFTNIKALLLHLCDFDQDLCLWVMRWLAYPLRNPGSKMDRALVVNGEDGTGKALFFTKVAARLYEDDDSRVILDFQLHAAFNGWAKSRFVVADGTYTKATAARLKELVTASGLIVEERKERPRRRKNYMNLVFLSNSTEFLPVIESDRRLCVIEAPPPRERSFYAAAAYEIENGGVDAFRDFLLRDLDMGDFDEHTMPPRHQAGRVLEAA